MIYWTFSKLTVNPCCFPKLYSSLQAASAAFVASTMMNSNKPSVTVFLNDFIRQPAQVCSWLASYLQTGSDDFCENYIFIILNLLLNVDRIVFNYLCSCVVLRVFVLADKVIIDAENPNGRLESIVLDVLDLLRQVRFTAARWSAHNYDNSVCREGERERV